MSDQTLYANQYGDGMRAVYEAVADGLQTADEIAEVLRMPLPTVRTYLSRLVIARWLYRPNRGHYAVAEDGRPFVVEDYDTGRRAPSVNR